MAAFSALVRPKSGQHGQVTKPARLLANYQDVVDTRAHVRRRMADCLTVCLDRAWHLIGECRMSLCQWRWSASTSAVQRIARSTAWRRLVAVGLIALNFRFAVFGSRLIRNARRTNMLRVKFASINCRSVASASV